MVADPTNLTLGALSKNFKTEILASVADYIFSDFGFKANLMFGGAINLSTLPVQDLGFSLMFCNMSTKTNCSAATQRHASIQLM